MILALNRQILSGVSLCNQINADIRAWKAELVSDTRWQIGLMPDVSELAAVNRVDLKVEFCQ